MRTMRGRTNRGQGVFKNLDLNWNGFNKSKRIIFKLSNDISHSSWVNYRATLPVDDVVLREIGTGLCLEY